MVFSLSNYWMETLFVHACVTVTALKPIPNIDYNIFYYRTKFGWPRFETDEVYSEHTDIHTHTHTHTYIYMCVYKMYWGWRGANKHDDIIYYKRAVFLRKSVRHNLSVIRYWKIELKNVNKTEWNIMKFSV